MRIKEFLLLFLLWACCYAGYGQTSIRDTTFLARAPYEIGLKTNLVYDATATINLGVEFPLSRRWSLDLSGNYNGWSFRDDRKWKHWLVQPEFRFWTKTRQQGHFVGIHALGGVYNLNRMHLPFTAWPSTATQRHEGWGVGAGLAYGYRWNFNERWGMEGVLGVGYIYSEYDIYCPNNCGIRVGSNTKHYFGPTKIALNLIYRLGKKSRMVEVARLAALNAPRPIIKERIVRDTIIIHDTVEVRDTVMVEAPSHTPQFHNKSYTFKLLQYDAGSARIRRELSDNQTSLVNFKEFLDRIKSDTTIVIQRISLTGYCSIEGTAQVNERLSYLRAQNVREYLLGFYPWMKEIISVEGHGEDWAGLLRLVEASDNTTWKEAITRIILNTGVYEGREKRLMELYSGEPYRWMFREFFPELRRIECNVECNAR